jgi:hypothetical protein
MVFRFGMLRGIVFLRLFMFSMVVLLDQTSQVHFPQTQQVISVLKKFFMLIRRHEIGRSGSLGFDGWLCDGK